LFWHQSEPIPTSQNSAVNEIAETPEQAKSHHQPQQKPKMLGGSPEKALREPRKTSEKEVPEGTAKIEDSPAKIAKALCSDQSRGGQHASSATC
jgi:hypothetical protein